MTQYADQIREAFESHEHLAPDAASVFARSQQLARIYRRRRVGAQAAGGAVLGASLVAGGVRLPGLLRDDSARPLVIQPAVAGSASATMPSPGASSSLSPSPSPWPSVSEEELARRREAYFAAGYDLDSARKLAALWHMSAQPGDLDAVKADAGRRILSGEPLPVAPNPVAATDTGESRAVSAFLLAGYDYADAERLAELWKTADPSAAKVMAGEKLLAGETLPIAPDPAAVADAKKAQAVDAFFVAGYDFADAQQLAALWKTASEYDAKVMAGEKLIAGETLPIAP